MASNWFIERLRQGYDRYPVLFHIGGWLAFIILPEPMLSFPELLSQSEIMRMYSVRWISSLLIIGLFYFNLHLLTPYLLRRRWLGWLPVMVPVLVVLLLLATRAVFLLLIGDDSPILAGKLVEFGQSLIQKQRIVGVPLPMAAATVLMAVVMISASSGLVVYQERQAFEAQHQQTVIARQEAELNALKLQISPHFLFNTLNNMRWLARQKSEQTEEAILRLSDMLRYMIYQVNQGPVSIQKEIDYLTDYVALQKLRLGAHNQVNFETHVDNERVLIEPLLLIHFVENAFKHGMHHNEPSTVTIRLTVADGMLTFETSNRLFTNELGPLVADSGVGIQNVERRLTLHYPNRHLLRIQHKNGHFCVALRIDLTTASQPA
jgi:hypothetical protein